MVPPAFHTLDKPNLEKEKLDSDQWKAVLPAAHPSDGFVARANSVSFIFRPRLNVSSICLVKFVYLFEEYYLLTRAPCVCQRNQMVMAVVFSFITFMFLCTDHISFYVCEFILAVCVIWCLVVMTCLFSPAALASQINTKVIVIHTSCSAVFDMSVHVLCL